MAKQKFGSNWTAQKLGAVNDYARAWMRIMHKQRQNWGWQCRYIDAFSGTGSYEPSKHDEDVILGQDSLFSPEETASERTEIRKGSAKLAIEVEPQFDRIDLIEKNRAFARSLRQVAGEELDERVFVYQEDANSALLRICNNLTRQRDRALVFIDPFGCHVWWETLKAVADSQVSDVFYLFPTMGVTRQVAEFPEQIRPKTQELLDRVLGTTEWRQEFYGKEFGVNLFGEYDKTTRSSGPVAVERFFIRRLRTIFPCVHADCLRLKNSRNGHMFSLCFAVANPNQKAQELAIRIAKRVITKWEGKA